MIKLIDVHHPWFKPLWRRILVVILPLGWAMFELSRGDDLWALLFGAIGVYAAYMLFWVFRTEHANSESEG